MFNKYCPLMSGHCCYENECILWSRSIHNCLVVTALESYIHSDTQIEVYDPSTTDLEHTVTYPLEIFKGGATIGTVEELDSNGRLSRRDRRGDPSK